MTHKYSILYLVEYKNENNNNNIYIKKKKKSNRSVTRHEIKYIHYTIPCHHTCRTCFHSNRNPPHSFLNVRRHAVPVRLDLVVRR